jgi:uncharacterized protein (TIGR02271 family)
MPHKAGHSGEEVVGVFMDQGSAQQAAQALQSAGFTAREADESAIEAFRNSGFQDEVVDLYRSRYDEGNSILVVEGQGRGEDALGIMLQYGAEYLNLSGQGGSTGGSQMQGEQYDASRYREIGQDQRQYGQYDQEMGRARNAEEMRVQLRREELVPTKQAVQAGEVEVHKVVHERQEQIPVTARHEEVYVERRPVQGDARADEIRDTDDEVMRVPVYEERVDVQKQTRVAEEVTIGKRTVEEQGTVTGTTRHEHIEVDDQDVRTRSTNVETDMQEGDEGSTSRKGSSRR